MLGDVHRFRGCNVSYAIKCQGGEEGYHVYVGSTRDVEQRMMNHSRGRAAKVTKCRPPTGEVLHIREHDTYREAMLCEVALWNLWAGKVGSDRTRGGHERADALPTQGVDICHRAHREYERTQRLSEVSRR